MKAPIKKPVVQLIGSDSNPFAIMGTVKSALKKAGADQEYIEQYITKATYSDYDNVLAVTMDYVDIE